MTFHALISEFASQTNRFYKTKTRIYVLTRNLSNLGQTPPVSFCITDVLFFFILMLVTKSVVVRIFYKIHLDKHDSLKALNEFYVLFSLLKNNQIVLVY